MMKRANRSLSLMLLLALAVGLPACTYLPTWMGGKKPEKAKLTGERIAVLPADSEFQPDEAVKAMPFTLPPATMNADWPQSGTFTAATGNLGATGDFTTTEHASAGGGESFERAGIPRPVVGGGLVFAMDAVGNISAHDAAHVASVRWQSKGVATEDDPDAAGGGLAYDQGRLYGVSGRGVVAAIDATNGHEFWRKSFNLPFRSPPRVEGGRLFAVTLDNQVYAINTISGEVLWSARGINETAGLMSTASPAVSGEMVIVPYSSGEIYALSASGGKEIWSDSLTPGSRLQASASFAGIGGDPVVDGSVVVAVSAGGMMSVFSAAAGQRAWERPIGGVNTPWIAGDYLFLMASDNTLICMVKYDGRIRWATKLASYENEAERENPVLWKGPVMVDGKLYIVSSNGQMLIVNAADGQVASTRQIPEGIATSPVVAGGRMYLLGQNATLHQLQ